MFLTEPKVHIIGCTVMRPLDAWAKDHDLVPQLLDTQSPLGNIGASLSPVNLVEFMGRHCYRSWSKGRGTQEYIENIIDEGHTSVMEHTTINFAISGVSRSLSHELVRHRVGVAISQESQRYVEAKDLNFVVPPLYLYESGGELMGPRIDSFITECHGAQLAYAALMDSMATGDTTLDKKRRTESARSVLGNAAETRLGWTVNMTALRHFFMKRGALGADLEIRRLACKMFNVVKRDESPFYMFFQDMDIAPGDYGVTQIQDLNP